jgi:hypothetical protein
LAHVVRCVHVHFDQAQMTLDRVPAILRVVSNTDLDYCVAWISVASAVGVGKQLKEVVR